MNFKEVYKYYEEIKTKIKQIDYALTILDDEDELDDIVREELNYSICVLRCEKDKLGKQLQEYESLHVYNKNYNENKNETQPDKKINFIDNALHILEDTDFDINNFNYVESILNREKSRLQDVLKQYET